MTVLSTKRTTSKDEYWKYFLTSVYSTITLRLMNVSNRRQKFLCDPIVGKLDVVLNEIDGIKHYENDPEMLSKKAFKAIELISDLEPVLYAYFTAESIEKKKRDNIINALNREIDLLVIKAGLNQEDINKFKLYSMKLPSADFKVGVNLENLQEFALAQIIHAPKRIPGTSQSLIFEAINSALYYSLIANSIQMNTKENIEKRIEYAQMAKDKLASNELLLFNFMQLTNCGENKIKKWTALYVNCIKSLDEWNKFHRKSLKKIANEQQNFEETNQPQETVKEAAAEETQIKSD